MDPLQWMGAVRMRVQTADKNITIMFRLKYESSINKIAFQFAFHGLAFLPEVMVQS